MATVKSKFVKVVTVVDPDTHEEVELEIHKDPESGAVFGIDSTYLDQMTSRIRSPFNRGTVIECQEPE